MEYVCALRCSCSAHCAVCTHYLFIYVEFTRFDLTPRIASSRLNCALVYPYFRILFFPFNLIHFRLLPSQRVQRTFDGTEHSHSHTHKHSQFHQTLRAHKKMQLFFLTIVRRQIAPTQFKSNLNCTREFKLFLPFYFFVFVLFVSFFIFVTDGHTKMRK